MRRVLLALLLCVSTGSAAATLEVQVDNLRPGKGEVLVTVCTEDTFLADHCRYRGRAPARGSEALVTIPGIPPGTYAVQAFQDEAPFRFGPPSFADAAVQLTPGGGRLRLRLRYFD